ncbi:MAG: hypothetical protein AAGE98_20790, partial [Actinomycetota bacterium]
MGSRSILRDALLLLRVWAVVFGGASALLFVLSDGEPACEGPLIFDIDDSLPLQCNTLTEGYERYLPALLLGTLIIAAIARVVIVLIGRGRRRRSTQAHEGGSSRVGDGRSNA